MSGLDGGGGHGGGDHGLSHEGGHGHGGHHGNDSAHGGHATHEALMLAFSHGQSSHLSVVGSHVSGAHAHSMQMVHLGLGRQDTKVGEQGKDESDPGEIRTFVVHVSNHGQAAINGVIQSVARQCDMLRIDQMRPNYDSADIMKYEIADWTAFSEPYQHVNMPEGFYPGATGHTRILRQYWQVGKRPSLWAPKTAPVFDKLAMTFIEVTSITWRYFETGDYETKFILTVGSLPVWDETVGAWGYKREPFERHQRAAKKLCEKIFEYLANLEPSPAAKLFRAEMLRKYPPAPGQDHPDGVEPGTPEDEADLSRGRKDDRETHPLPKPDPAGDGDGDVSDGVDAGDGGEGIVSLAPDAGVVASGVDLDAVLGHADSVVVKAPVPVKVKTADLVVELDD